MNENSRSLYRPLPGSAEDQATEWFMRLRGGTRTPALQAEFDRWLAADPAHEREYRAVERLWCELTPYGRSDEVRVLRHQAVEDSEAAAHRHRRGRHLRALRSLAAGAGLVALAGLLAINQFPLQQARYQTESGDRHTVYLADGSEVTLNTDTILRVDFGWRTRSVVLERGQAHFKVAHAVLRPFEVDAGSGVVRALGTAFDVYRNGEDVQVTLVEGKVEVASLLALAANAPRPDAAHPQKAVLKPGQQVSVTPVGVSSVRPTSIPKATAWLSGRLVFDNERLQDAAGEVNRYSPVKVVVLDRELADMRISGVFRAGRAETFVDALRASYPIDVVTAADSTLILRPSSQRIVAAP